MNKNYSNMIGKVAVLMGGRSAEREVSLMSGEAVVKALTSLGIQAHAFDPAKKSVFNLKTENYDVCFIALHGRYGEDGTIQGALELMGIPYTGSGVLSSSVAMNKAITKSIWRSMGLSTPRWQEVNSVEETEKVFETMGNVMIVKPAREGSTIGLTKVTQLSQCQLAFEVASRQDNLVLCEQYISGDEVTCSILDRSDSIHKAKNTIALPVIRIIAPDSNYDYQNKYFTNDTKYMVPSGLPTGEEEEIKKMVLAAYSAIGCRGWARADVMIDRESRKPYLLEINTSPGMTNHSLFPMAAAAMGINFENLCLRILQSAQLDYPIEHN
ncbi:MAG TPA: D-alanine--D-alanine ligase [Burkholderiaceae bacterium]|nr:D-alanine--D-alanine ligase [Burkholderiaceae bacterium]